MLRVGLRAGLALALVGAMGANYLGNPLVLVGAAVRGLGSRTIPQIGPLLAAHVVSILMGAVLRRMVSVIPAVATPPV
jgi:hypothetical protein